MTWGILLVAAFLSAFAFGFSAWALIQVESIKRATHQVTFLDPTKQAFESMTEELKEQFKNS